MKNKFGRLTRDEKRDAKKRYKNASDKNLNVSKSYFRVTILCLAGIIFSFASFAFDIYMQGKLTDYLVDSFLLVACLLAYFKFRDIYYKEINTFLINENKDNKKSKVKKKNK